MALIAMAGLPGVGKTTVALGLAERMPAAVVNVDRVESSLVKAEFERSFATGLASYLVAEQVARDNLALGHHVIVDAANYVTYARDMWTRLAREQSTPLLFVEVVCADLALHQARLEAREVVPGLPRLTFDDVVARYAETEPWAGEPHWLVDNARPLDHDRVFAEVMAVLGK